MAFVYSNVHLTVTATRSANGDGGLFTKTPDVEVTWKTPDGEDYTEFVSREDQPSLGKSRRWWD